MNKQHEASKIMQEFISNITKVQDEQAKQIAELSEKVGRLEKGIPEKTIIDMKIINGFVNNKLK